MENLFLIIGPTGVGKSSAINCITPSPSLKIFVLDDEMKKEHKVDSISKYFSNVGNEEFFRQSIATIEQIKQHNEDVMVLIDVGAGSIDWPGCVETYLQYEVICLSGEPELLYQRLLNRPNEQRSFGEYSASEFKPHRRRLYEGARFRVDTSEMAIEEVAYQILEIVNN